MADTWSSAWAAQWTAGAQRFNPNHASAGSATGGQFTSGGSGSSAKGSGGSGKGSGAKAAAKPLTAHQKHALHEQHLASHPNSPAAKAARKAALLDQAKADRKKAAALGVQLKGLEAQEAKAVAAAKHTAAAAASAKAGPNAKKSLATAAAPKKAAAKKAAPKKVTLKAQIAGVRAQIGTLLGQARTAEAQAAAL